MRIGSLSLFFCLLIAGETNGNDKNSDCVKYNRKTLTELDTNKKLFVNCLGYNLESGQADLVVLIDRSGSMYSYNSNSMNGFDVAKQFVKSLLSEVRIAYNATRIAVGTFSSNHRIDFNYITNPDVGNHKCKFNEDFKKLYLTGGLTNIRGSLIDALNVFQTTIDNPVPHKHRYRANKVVILLSDGEGNEFEGPGDPRDASLEADKLKAGSRILYTVGVTPGSQMTRMESWASHKSAAFYANTFNDLLTLAHNIRGDPYEQDYETEKVSEHHCNTCGKNAECGCNLKTGLFRCTCKRGYYGTGDTDCKPCEPNTYGDRRGNIKGCTPCPENSVTKLQTGFVSQSLADCKCDTGFDGEPKDNRPCKPIACVAYPSVNFAGPKNKAVCEKATYGNKCYYKCIDGYKMISKNDHVTCTESTHWSEPRPVCKKIVCKADWVNANDRNRFTPQCNNAEEIGTNDLFKSGTKCTFKCNSEYYQKSGSTEINCLEDGKWDNERAYCEISKCTTIKRSSTYIKIKKTSKDCFQTQLNVKDTCEFECEKGFSLSQPIIECWPGNLAVGKWSVDTDKDTPTCTDTEAPKFAEEKASDCNQGIVLRKTTLPGKSYAAINFEHIQATDNSGVPPEISCLTDNDAPCEYKMGVEYNIGIVNGMRIRFKATDEIGLFKYCRFQLFVEDKEKPTLMKCPGKIEKETEKDSEKIDWQEPEYTDNCGDYAKCPLKIIPSNYPGSDFPVGSETTVTYTATDPSNNVNEECSFIVKIKKKEPTKCGYLEPPRNGLVTYTYQRMYALMYCRAGFYPDRKIAFMYLCRAGKWADPNPNPLTAAKLPLPDCLLRQAPDAEIQQIIGLLSFTADCNDAAIKQEISQKAMMVLGDITGLEYHCGATTLVNRRKRSTAKTISLKFKVASKGDENNLKKDPAAELARIKKELRDVVIPRFKATLTNKKNWNNLNKFAGSFSSIREIGNSQETCNQPGLVKAAITRSLRENCARCGAGTFQNLKTEKCEKCPAGTYQPEEGKTTCLSCPAGTVVVGDDIKNFTSCKNLCEPGEYSPNGLSPCFICPVGHYSDTLRATSCTKCPGGTTTVKTGSKSKYECGSTCNIGSYSSNGVEPCQPCTKGSYQSERGQTRCLDCPDLQSTAGEGSTSRSSCMNIPDCLSNPCLNGANCVDLKDDYKCQCPRGYWGHDCEKEVNECALKPCLNNATCVDKHDSYLCRCLPGTGGRHCDQVVNRCNSNTCAQHGKCVDLPEHRYKCVCDVGYTGEFCEAKIDYCAAQPCLNEGFCKNTNTEKKFQCLCKKGYEGPTCEVKINHCSSTPCKNNGVCIDQKEGYLCKCPKGYEGLSCETRTNMCLHKKCHNGGKCINGFDDVTCLCAPGFSGMQCDTVEKTDFDFHFQSRVSTSFSSIHGRKDLHHFTLAFWMRTSDKENIGTPISYAVKKGSYVDDNALFMNDYSNFILGINNETQSLGFDANDGEWHHVAVTWTSSSGLWIAYRDGVEIRRASKPMQQRKYVPKDGLFVIGEEQDAFGGDFTPEESFFGDLSQLNIWDRVFSSSEIYDLASSCGHSQGNVVAWSDFNPQITGNIEKTSPSLACDFRNDLRNFQYLKDATLPNNLKSVGNSMFYKLSSALQCAQHCKRHSEWCRTFTYSTFSCNLYHGSVLISQEEEINQPGTDLYSLSCVRTLGLSNGRIAKSQIKASTYKAGAIPDLGRLHRVPKSGEMYSSWQPADNDKNPYIEVDLGEECIVTGIATQGHFDRKRREFATSYVPAYRVGNSWKYWKELKGNSDSTTVKRNEVSFNARYVRLYPKRNSQSSGLAFRFELYGCPERAQGTPVVKSDNNDCSGNPCLNGGKCYNLYRRYICVCPRNYEGNNCQTRRTCSVQDLDIPINGMGKLISSSHVNFVCKAGYKMVGSASSTCSNMVWSKGNTQCVDIDECSSNVCSDGCENSQGSYRCLCPRGKVLGSDQKNCIDVNECNGDSGCQYQCVNLFGSYQCSCPVGHYSKGDRVCYDQNECDLGTHGCQHLCENTKGGFKCHCKPGFNLHPNGKSCTPYNCPTLHNIPNIASISVKNNIATYTCKTGYKVNGPMQRTCLPDATWSGRQPSCDAIQCNQLYKPEFGVMRSIGTASLKYGATYVFGCLSGYRLVGSQTRKCQNINNQAIWSGKQPYCVRSGCPPFTNVNNGKVLGMNTEVGSSVRVQCNDGFKLNDQAYFFRKCESNLQWSGPNGNNAHVECVKIRCGQPPKTGNVIVKLTGGDAYQATASYSCYANQCLNGAKTRHCQADGKWSGANPTCLSNACCKPLVPKYSTLYSDGKYQVNSYAYIQCYKGYNLVGSDFRECQSNLKWSGTDSQCNIVNCGDPGDLTNGIRRTDEGFTYMSTIKYFCNPGFVLKGSREQVCNTDGKWSGTKPTCQRGNGGYENGKSGTIECKDGETCHWLIQVTQGQKVRLTFTTFTFNDETDRAEVYDGKDNLKPYVTFTKALEPRQITANGHFVRIISNGHVVIKYEESQCGGMLSEKKGVITSPNFPNGYPNDLNCVWTIHRPYNRIELLFLKFLLQRYHTDNVTVTEGPFKNTDTLIYKYGYGIPYMNKDFADRWLWINFVSDYVHNDKGFQAIWRPFEPRV